MNGLITTAFVPAAGRGTRLRPYTSRLPKPLLPLGGRPIITHVWDRLVDCGVRCLIVNTHYLAGCFDEMFDPPIWRGVPLVFRYEPVLLDTGGGLKNIEPLVGEGYLLVHNGDLYSTMPMAPLIQSHLESGAEVTLALRSTGGARNVAMDRNGVVRDMRHVMGCRFLPHFVFTGIYVVSRRFFNRLPPGRVFGIVDTFLAMIAYGDNGLRGVVIDDGQWADLGTVKEYESLSVRLIGC